MAKTLRIFTKSKLGLSVRTIIFLIACFLVCCYWINPKLIVYGYSELFYIPIYVPGSEWFVDSPTYPGKCLDFLAAYLTHYYAYLWMGSLIITLVIWLLTWLAGRVIQVMQGEKLFFLRYIPAIIVMMQNGRYNHDLSRSLFLICILVLFCLYNLISLRHSWLRMTLFLLLVILGYVLAAPFYWVFPAFTIMYEIFIRRNWRMGAFCVILSIFVPYLGSTYYGHGMQEAYLCTWISSCFPDIGYGDRMLGNINYFLLPLIGLSCVCFNIINDRYFRKSKSNKRHPGSDTLQVATNSNRSVWQINSLIGLKWLLTTSVLLLILFGGFRLTRNDVRCKYLHLISLARQEKWTELLSEAQVFPNQCYDRYICFYVNRALYHTGQLSQKMFSFPQQPKALLLHTNIRYGGKERVRHYSALCDLSYEFGHINKSEDLCYEAMTMSSYSPWILKRLALIYIVKEQPEAAVTCLWKLRKDYLYRDWAIKWLEQLEKDPMMLKNLEIQYIRSVMPQSDSIQETITARDFFQPLFNRNRNNRMAYEYLTAMYLLTNDLDSFISVFSQLNDLCGPEIPMHHQEAILLYSKMSNKPISIWRGKLSRVNIVRFNRFFKTYEQYRNDLNAAAQVLAKDFENTYYYYNLIIFPTLQKSAAK